ncbi:MAG: spermidine synthase-like protein, partial [Bacteroidota bacterium]
MNKLLASVTLLSVALIAFQLVLMQILSIVQWYHFAYMVISVALLGFGASGSLIALAREWLLKREEYLLPLLMTLCGAAMAVAVRVSQSDAIRFDSYLLFVEGGQVRRLVLTYLTFFVPFFVGALALGLIFVRHVDRIGSVYFANLVGSGAGGLIALALLWLFMPQQLPSLVALLPIAAALFIIPSRQRSLLVLMAAVIAALAFYCIASSPQLNISDYKSIRRTLNLPDAKVVFERSSPHGLVQVVSSPALRYAPGLSLTYKDSVPSCAIVFNNGDWFGPLVAATVGVQVLRSTTLSLPYMLKPR